MWCAVLVLVLGLLRETLSAPFEKPVLLFSCPRNAECYASPPNCVDDCNAAVSMRNSNGTTTFNITMLSGLQGYVALLMRQNTKGNVDYDKAVVCSFHHPRGIVARVNYPEPIKIQEFIETTEPLGNTDSMHTQCSTSASIAIPSKASFKLISGKWKSELLIDEKLGVDVVPAVQNAKILSTNEMLSIPEPKSIPSTRSSDEDDDKASEDFVQKNQFENKLKDMKDRKDDDDDDDEKVRNEDDESEKDSTVEKPRKSSKDDMEKEDKTKKTKVDSRKGRKDDDEKKSGEEEDEDKKKSRGSNEESEENPRFRELDDEDEEDENKKEDDEKEDPDDAPSLSILMSAAITILFFYIM